MENNPETDKVGFFYSVTKEQVEEHRKRSIEEILEWLESTNELIWSLQTEEERERKNFFKRKYKQ